MNKPTPGVHYRDRTPCMITRSGRLVPVGEPSLVGPRTPDAVRFSKADVHIPDIIHALSNICRFNGHLEVFYSVAQHSVLVAERIFEVTKDPEQALVGLFHDGAEAYVGDMTRPLKISWHMYDYRELCDDIQQCIYSVLDIKESSCPMLKSVDNDLIYFEATQLGHWPVHDWNLATPEWHREILPLLPHEARNAFRAAFRYYEDLRHNPNPDQGVRRGV